MYLFTVSEKFQLIQQISYFEKNKNRITDIVGLREYSTLNSIWISTVDGEIYHAKFKDFVANYLYILKKRLEQSYNRNIIKLIFEMIKKPY